MGEHAYTHVPVMAGRVTALLVPALSAPVPGGRPPVLVDATLGRAGHARALLAACPGLLLIGIYADETAIAKDARCYFRLAKALINPPAPRLIAVGGLSGTGKSLLARMLAPIVPPQPGADSRARTTSHSRRPDAPRATLCPSRGINVPDFPRGADDCDVVHVPLVAEVPGA